MSLRSLTLRHGLFLAACTAILAGCPTGTDPDTSTDDGGVADEGGTVTPDSGPGPKTDSSVPDSSKADASPPVPCGRLTTLCKDGEKCTGGADCVSTFCFNNLCKMPAPADGVKNGDETDVDCGGSKAPPCADNKGCLVKADCKSGVCTTKLCQVPTSTDGVQNGDETGIDCGGTTTNAPKCAAGQGCVTSADCDNIKCDTVQKKCLPAAHDDGIKNLDETGIDCGGPTAGVARCPTGQGCVATSDCNNVACNPGTNLCDPPTSTDGIKNGTETDIDCGGGAPTNAGPCAGGKVCTVNADCSSTACNYAGKCAWARSCKNHMGGDTCGKGNAGEAGAAQEDCCISIPLNATLAVDKYEITAGRMREFIAQTGGDVNTWVANHRAITGQIDDTMVQYLPTDLFNPVKSIKQCAANGSNCTTVNQSFGVYDYLGNNVFMPDRPCANCGQGCWYNTGAGQNGHPTYWWDPNTQTNQFGAAPRINTQAELDVKSLNCTPQLLFAAFCAWDGGRLPTQPELGGASGAWGPTGMPWGGANTAFRDTVAGNEAGRITYPFAQDNGTCPGNSCFAVPMFTVAGGYNANAANVNSTNFNPFPSSPAVFAARHVFPVPANTATNDQAYAVASPGRMRNDFRKIGPGADDGYYDLAANLIEVTATSSGADDANHNGWPRVKWVGGSFEGHTPDNRGGYDLSVLTKYGKQGARCVRAIP